MDSTPIVMAPSSVNNVSSNQSSCVDATCSVILTVIEVVIFVLGVAGNGLVIWITGCKMKKSVNTIWYLSLAVSDILFCAVMPIFIIYRVKDEWIFGPIMCKFSYFFISLNMYSSIFTLVTISVDRCLLVVFPVWAQNHRIVNKALMVVVLVWIISALASIPIVIWRIMVESNLCILRVDQKEDYIAIVVCRFILGFLIPFMIIFISSAIIARKLKNHQAVRSKKPLKIMTLLIIAFFICWLPFHILSLMKVHHYLNQNSPSEFYTIPELVSFLLIKASCFLNPFLYVIIGRDFKTQFHRVLSKIQSAVED